MIAHASTQSLDSLLGEAPFSAADRALVRFLRERMGESDPLVLMAAALSSLAARQGHTCLDLVKRPDFLPDTATWPSLAEWTERLKMSPCVGEEGVGRPLILSGASALYLAKYYEHESVLAGRLIALAEARPDGSAEPPEETRAAIVQRALQSRLFVITGGPGTGKTTIALSYLNALLDQWTEDEPPQIATVAPTGKAAARLSESIAAGLSRLDLPTERRELLAATPCLTIHRLLGALPSRVDFRRNGDNPLDLDVLVVDEASMIDLPLMRRLFEAIPSNCRTLLLGDRDQLASVEVGSVLSDLLTAAERGRSRLGKHVAWLSKTYRFSEESAIYRACQAARSGDLSRFEALLKESRADFAFHPVSEETRRPPERLLKLALLRHENLTKARDEAETLARLNDSIILAPTRVGPFGTQALNDEICRRLRAEAELPDAAPLHGMPLIVLENNYELELFNGDLGVAWLPDPEASSAPIALFPGRGAEIRRFRLAELPRYEAAFALTIHKSQGSEFEQTFALFGPSDSQLLTRELLYTCCSRAKARLELFGDLGTLLAAIGRRASRATRLAERLQEK